MQLLLLRDVSLRHFRFHLPRNNFAKIATEDGGQSEIVKYAVNTTECSNITVLVTGDKDFMPAMSRTRQKGRRVCLCSMRNSCNQDLLRDDAHVMDFAPVWINEHLDDMMEYAPSRFDGHQIAYIVDVAPVT